MSDFLFDNMIKFFRNTICDFPDIRTGSNTNYSVEDAALGAFSIFFSQNSSFLVFQNSMQQKKGKNNAQSLFGVLNIPCDNQIRNLLDEVNSASVSSVSPFFSYIFNGLNVNIRPAPHIRLFWSPPILACSHRIHMLGSPQ